MRSFWSSKRVIFLLGIRGKGLTVPLCTPYSGALLEEGRWRGCISTNSRDTPKSISRLRWRLRPAPWPRLAWNCYWAPGPERPSPKCRIGQAPNAYPFTGTKHMQWCQEGGTETQIESGSLFSGRLAVVSESSKKFQKSPNHQESLKGFMPLQEWKRDAKRVVQRKRRFVWSSIKSIFTGTRV